MRDYATELERNDFKNMFLITVNSLGFYRNNNFVYFNRKIIFAIC